jgi:hypothetical protein
MDIRISRSDDATTIWLWINGTTRTFDAAAWVELSAMMRDFNVSGSRSMQNFLELPTKTPIHANTPRKASLDDLV